ncbi:MAG: threonine synthase [Bacteroidales bacterium]|nr:threonine synthase [Bacteroidales bacterium]
MQYFSTNNHSSKVSLRDAILHSQAPDGGLYMPDNLPRFPQAIFNNIAEMTPIEISYFIAYSLFGSDIPSAEIKRIGEGALKFPIPLVEIEPGIYALELFHGPTCTVKDIGIRYLARMLSALNPDFPKPLNVMVATTGHSGSAVANGFHHVDGVNVFAMYPSQTPDRQVAQLAMLGDNVYAVSINGNIDQCRNLVRSTIADKDLNEKIRFTCVNSVNIGRVLPGIIPYFLGYAQLQAKQPKHGPIKVSVPCGNGGMLLAGYFAKRMGLPIGQLIAANNANGAFCRYLSQDKADLTEATKRTRAYAMDATVPTNLPRFELLCNGNKEVLRRDIMADSCTDAEIDSTIRDVLSRTGYMLDPHSAVAYRCLKNNLAPGETGVFLATAHPARCLTTMQQITGRKIEIPPQLVKFTSGRGTERSLPATYPAWRKYLLNILKIRR